MLNSLEKDQPFLLGREGLGVDLAKGQASGEGEVLSEVGGGGLYKEEKF